MRVTVLFFISVLFFHGCNPSQDSNTEEKSISNDSLEESIQLDATEKKAEEKVSVYQELSELLKTHQFEICTKYIRDNSIDLNDFITIDKSRQNITARRILPEMIHVYCDTSITSFLLDAKADPNLPSLSISIPEYSSTAIPQDFDIRKSDLAPFEKQGYLYRDYAMKKSLSCEDSTIFYMLLKAGANQQDDVLQGAIKWSDTDLIKKMIAKDIKLNTVPKSDNPEILNLLVPITDGKKFGEVEYGEGGDMFDTDLMIASRDGNKNLVRFMLETGADPNACLPSNITKDENREVIGMDENGYYPAVTALSIARDEYIYNMNLSENRKDSANFIEKAKRYKEIEKSLLSYGAKEIPKCLGP